MAVENFDGDQQHSRMLRTQKGFGWGFQWEPPDYFGLFREVAGLRTEKKTVSQKRPS